MTTKTLTGTYSYYALSTEFDKLVLTSTAQLGHLQVTGTANIYNHGTIYSNGVDAVTDTGSGTFVNYGLVEAQGFSKGSGISLASGAIINHGEIEGGAGGAGNGISLGTGTIVNYGSVGFFYPSTSDKAGGAINLGSGTLLNLGQISGGAEDQSTGSPAVVFSGLVVNGSSSNATAEIDGPAGIKGDGTLVNFGTIAGADRKAGFAVDLVGTLENFGVISGVGDLDPVISASGLVVNGSQTDSAAVIEGSPLGVSLGTGTLVNYGTIDATAHGSGVGSGDAVLFDSSSDVLMVGVSASFSGQVNGDGGTLELMSGLSPGNLSGLGTNFTEFSQADVLAGADWQLSNTYFSGTLTNHGSITFAGNGDLTGTIVDDGGLTVASDLTVAGSIDLLSGSNVVVSGNGDLTLSGTIGGEGTLTTDTYALRTGADLTGNWRIASTLTWINESGVHDASLGTLAGTLVNEADGKFDFYANGGIVRGSSATSIVNEGLIEKTGGGLSDVGAPINNQGTILVTDGDLDLTGSIVGTGTIAIDHGALLATDGPIVIGATGSGELILGGTIDLDGTLTTGESGGPTSADLTRNWEIGGNGVWINDGDVTDASLGTLGDSQGHRVLLENEAGAVFQLYDNGGIERGTSKATSVINYGVIEKTGGGVSEVDVPIVNEGTILVTSGFLDLSGTITGPGKIVIDSGAELILAGTIAGSGTLTTGESDGPTAADLDGQWEIGGTVVWINNGGVHDGSLGTLGDSLGHSARIVNQAGAKFDFYDDGGMLQGVSTASSMTNYGIVEKSGGGVSKVAVPIVNQGTILASSGQLDLSGSITGAGTIAIDSAGVFDVAASVAATQTVAFDGSGGTLVIADPSLFRAAIEDFGADGSAKDRLVFSTVAFGSASKLTYNAANGILTLTDGAETASVKLFGQYVQAGFHLEAYGAHGTEITYVPPPEQPAKLAPSG